MSLFWATSYDIAGTPPKLTRLNTKTLVCLDGSAGGIDNNASVVPLPQNTYAISIVANDLELIFGTTLNAVDKNTLVNVTSTITGSNFPTAVSDSTYIYGYDTNTGQIRRHLKSTGAFVNTLFSSGSGAGQVNLPVAMHRFRNYLYIVEQNGKRLKVVNTDDFSYTNLNFAVSGASVTLLRTCIFDNIAMYVGIQGLIGAGYQYFLQKYDFRLPDRLGNLQKQVRVSSNSSFYARGAAIDDDNLVMFNSSSPEVVGDAGEPTKRFYLVNKNSLEYTGVSSNLYRIGQNTLGAAMFDDWPRILATIPTWANNFGAATGAARRKKYTTFNPADII